MPVSAAMETYLTGNVLFLTGCWKITAKDGAVRAVTTCTRDLTIGGVTYWPSPFLPSQVETRDDGEPSSADFRGVLHANLFTREELGRGKWRGARVEFEAWNPRDLSLGYSERHVFYMGDVQAQGPMFHADMDSLLVKLNQPKGAVTQPKCRRELGDSICQVDLAPFTNAATVTAVNADGTFRIAPVGRAAGFFTNGTVLWLTGDNLGAPRVRVREHAGWPAEDPANATHVKLMLRMRAAVKVGDTLEIVAGCDKTRTQCRVKFNNVVNMDAEPDQPGNGELYKLPE